MSKSLPISMDMYMYKSKSKVLIILYDGSYDHLRDGSDVSYGIPTRGMYPFSD